MSKSAKELHGEQLYKMTWANKYPWVFVLALFRLLVYICKLQVARGMVATVSSFISGAGYGLREKKGLKKFALIAIGGGGALCFAFLAVCCKLPASSRRNFFVWDFFEATELDVLGTIFTQAKWYAFAGKCYWTIQGKTYVSDETIAMSSKWWSKNPHLSPADVERLKAKVLRLIELHPEWAETTLARLWEFVGDEEKEKRSRVRIRQGLI